MENENAITKPTVEQAAVAERTRNGCCYLSKRRYCRYGEDELLVLADVRPRQRATRST